MTYRITIVTASSASLVAIRFTTASNVGPTDEEMFAAYLFGLLYATAGGER